MKGISVILCCYNSAKRLPTTLAYLARQKTLDNLRWELIVVNNNSTDATERVAENEWHSLGAPAPLTVVKEVKPGLLNAREKGISVANYDLLLWCDDDNWLCDTYVQTSYDIMETHLDIGALGGWCEAAFEVEKPEWFDAQAHFFAVSKQGKRSGDITSKKGCVFGAGMVTRKSHAETLNELGFRQILIGRKGTKLSSGEDTELCYALRLIGYKIWYDERLYFIHFMSQGRLSLSYVSRLRKARTHSNFILWPYLDLLIGQPRNRSQLLKFAFKGGALRCFKKGLALIIGDYEQREEAKRYFMFQRYCLFHYKTYKRNLIFIKNWAP